MSESTPSPAESRTDERTNRHKLRVGGWTENGFQMILAGKSGLALKLRLDGKIASLMILLSVPSLVFCSLLTIPSLLFPSPHQHAYFQFARVLNEDPTRWYAYYLAAACAVIALVIPAWEYRKSSLAGSIIR